MAIARNKTGKESVTKTTADDAIDYAEGDWVVHCHHGLGQIEAIKRKRVGELEKSYFCIKMADSVLWIPVDQLDTQQFRPLADKSRIKEAVAILKKPPKDMASNLSRRQAQIKQVVDNNIPTETARLIRDLRARRREKKGLNQSERRALRDLTRRFLQEWSVCVGLPLKQARRQLNSQLRRRQSTAKNHSDNGQENDGRREPSPILDALAKRDDRWSDWFKQKQIAKGA